ncbi:L-threonate dehydrogenase [Mongoliimonas terrestris]|uniref:L-threonate dehydrogenase n=1 Tax=Mongoliimonas terrestris TaxID=1709001 RepID=UPI0009498DBB|nr:L-threonate dehydrogenase [Mongoliimonas terrestris]
MSHRVMAVAGLGSMGHGIALSLLSAGHTVYGADVNRDRVSRLVAAGGRDGTATVVSADIDTLVVVVLNAAQVEAVLFGAQGWVSRLKPGAVIIGSTTVAPDFARRMADQVEGAGLHYLDAPISGGAARAAEGRLSVMASGSPAAFAAAEPALAAIAETVHRLGDVAGTGSAMKAVNQLLAGVHIAAMGEALAFAVSQGLELGRVVKVISGSAGTSWMFENRAPHVVDGDYAPRSAVGIWPKDLGIVAEIAARAGLPVPMTETALARFRAAAEAGFGAEDDAAVTKIYAREGRLKLPGEP